MKMTPVEVKDERGICYNSDEMGQRLQDGAMTDINVSTAPDLL